MFFTFALLPNTVNAINNFEMTDVLCQECGSYKEACEPFQATCNISEQMFCCEVCGGCGPEE